MSHPHQGRTPLAATAVARAVADATAPLTRSGIGKTSREDGYFLLSLLERERPAHILEVGVASGASTLMLLRMIERALPEATLLSLDLATAYYGDPSKPVGYLVGENYPSPPHGWQLVTETDLAGLTRHPGLNASALRRTFEMVYIDADHGHPWPTLDALCALPFVVPGTWVALHDINLPQLGNYPFHGADFVLRDWPLDVLIGDVGPIPNIGAIRLSDAGGADARRLIAGLDRPWDSRIDRSRAGQILAHLDTFLPQESLEAVRAAFARDAAASDR